MMDQACIGIQLPPPLGEGRGGGLRPVPLAGVVTVRAAPIPAFPQRGKE